MSTSKNHTTGAYQVRSIEELKALTSDFLLTRMGNAAWALYNKGTSWSRIAKILDYPNGDAIRMVAVRYGNRESEGK